MTSARKVVKNLYKMRYCLTCVRAFPLYMTSTSKAVGHYFWNLTLWVRPWVCQDTM